MPFPIIFRSDNSCLLCLEAGGWGPRGTTSIEAGVGRGTSGHDGTSRWGWGRGPRDTTVPRGQSGEGLRERLYLGARVRRTSGYDGTSGEGRASGHDGASRRGEGASKNDGASRRGEGGLGERRCIEAGKGGPRGTTMPRSKGEGNSGKDGA
ncbi:hypothetical protein KY290_013833 [Solanum tuberosum]|uniref:Uncharacterized protein n=1 Tax=Solanum tuberosum TaxID=4113 RepID=A0ABQ7VMV7_SOLTU|nr:hypothetical protein KY289_013951 [Solanum tuberosum]KAH0769852.1 hypothetical protein KY290_013833 [Solanum tuberosum]